MTTTRRVTPQILDHLIRPVRTQPKKRPNKLAVPATAHRNGEKSIPGEVLNVTESRNLPKSVARKKLS